MFSAIIEEASERHQVPAHQESPREISATSFVPESMTYHKSSRDELPSVVRVRLQNTIRDRKKAQEKSLRGVDSSVILPPVNIYNTRLDSKDVSGIGNVSIPNILNSRRSAPDVMEISKVDTYVDFMDNKPEEKEIEIEKAHPFSMLSVASTCNKLLIQPKFFEKRGTLCNSEFWHDRDKMKVVLSHRDHVIDAQKLPIRPENQQYMSVYRPGYYQKDHKIKKLLLREKDTVGVSLKIRAMATKDLKSLEPKPRFGSLTNRSESFQRLTLSTDKQRSIILDNVHQKYLSRGPSFEKLLNDSVLSKKFRGDQDNSRRIDGHFFGGGNNKGSPRGTFNRNRERNENILDGIHNISEINKVNISTDSMVDSLKPVIKPQLIQQVPAQTQFSMPNKYMPEIKKVTKTEEELLFEKPEHYDSLEDLKRKQDQQIYKQLNRKRVRTKVVKSLLSSLDKINELQGECEEEYLKSQKIHNEIRKTQENLEKKLDKMEKKTHLNPYNFQISAIYVLLFI